jgi:antitoxin component YwqK of YwqJK toxin-antitoxin module
MRCGEWETYTGGVLVDAIDYGDCAAVGRPAPPPDGGPPGPPTVSVWNAQSCPAGRLFTGDEPGGGRVAYCIVDNTRHGPIVRWYAGEPDVVWVVGEYDHNRRTGTWTEFHEDGSVAAQGAYADHDAIGIWRYWSRNGALIAEGKLAGEARQGTWTEYWGTGHPSAVGAYVNGSKDGVWQGFDPAGGLISEVTYSAGVRQGAARFFHSGGLQVEDAGDYEDGIRDGAWVGFYPNGARYWDGTYVYGRPHGIWMWYDTQDRPVLESTYDQSIPAGTWTWWLYGVEGEQYVEIPFAEGVRSGVSRGYWVEDDVPVFEETLAYGRLNGPTIGWYRGGQVWFEGHWIEDLRHGLWIWYYEDGQVSESGLWTVDRREGHWVFYWRNGQLKAEGDYRLATGDKESGWVYFLEDGTPATEEEVE